MQRLTGSFSGLAIPSLIRSAHAGAYSILGDIETIMGVPRVYAQQYKLNIYDEGDFFKTHVDTPDPDGMFGTLVVCLPCQHTGRELVIRHGPAEAFTDWAAGSKANVLQWVAFYSDCPHEIR